MNKKELINAMSVESGLNKTDSKKALNAFFSVVTKALESGDKVSLVGFGTFSVGVRNERNGVNPTNGQPIIIPCKKVAKFKPGIELVAAIK